MQVHVDRVKDVVEAAVAAVPVVDVHTHLYPACCKRLLLRGIDDLLTYHYLTVETLRYSHISPGAFFSLGVEQRADEVWRTLFIEHSPVSEACRGVLTVLKLYGLDAENRDLSEFRDFFAGMSPEDHVDMVFRRANLEHVVMTNDPFDQEETASWGPAFTADRRFLSAMRIDTVLNTPGYAMEVLRQRGYAVSCDMSDETMSEVRRFLDDVSRTINPVYLAASLPPSFRWSDQSACSELFRRAVLPFCREKGLPVALMIGVRKRANPELGLGGDSLGKAYVADLERLCGCNPDIRFLVTMLSREDQHELCVAARKFPNLMIFGCWWFLNNPSLVREITQMRIELLGLSFIPQHSDGRILDQLLYKWDHSKRVISDVLAEKYADLVRTGWRLDDSEIRRDVDLLFRGNARQILGL